MSRLTEKNKYNKHYGMTTTKTLLQDVYDKLGQYEDLEEQLGYPLKILIKVIVDQNVYIPDLKGYRRITIKNGNIYIKYKRKNYILPFEDYGKTWLLKEDIIKNE